MAKINNPEIIRNIIRAAKINIQVDKIPDQLAEKIVPVLIAKSEPERLVQVASASAVNATAATLHTTDAVKDTYLIGVSMCLTKDAVSDSEDTIIRVSPFGKAELTLLFFRYQPTTAETGMSETISFPQPIKLEKGTTVTVNNGAATAEIAASAVMYYYEEEP